MKKKIVNVEKFIKLSLEEKDEETLCKVSHALSAPERVRILRSISLYAKTLSDLSKELNIPLSSVSRHVDVLEEANLILITYRPGPKGHIKYCWKNLLGFNVILDKDLREDTKDEPYSVEMPIGMFTDCKIQEPCGLVSQNEVIGVVDNSTSFFLPQRANAERLWFQSGFLAYEFPSAPILKNSPSEISFSFEICSETVQFNNDWPSDITLWINDIELATFTSPGDFGGRQGKLTPKHWHVTSTQFGLLKRLTVNKNGVFLDYQCVNSHITIDDLHLDTKNNVKFSIGIKEDALHKGGINLFGKNYGDFPQAIVMSVL